MKDLLCLLNIGDEVYSPVCGKCEVVVLDKNEIYCITVKTPYGAHFDFDRWGRCAPSGEVLLITNKS